MTTVPPASTIDHGVTDDALRQARREMARQGGVARAAKLTPEAMSRIGKKAVRARERKRRLARKALKTQAVTPSEK